MKRYTWSEANTDERQRILARPDQRASPEVVAFVRQLFAEVADEGEAALRRWSKKLDDYEPATLELSPTVLDSARASLASEDIEAIDFAIDQVRFYHEATKPKPQAIEPLPGVRVRQVWRPIATCGLYVPAGTAPLVSTLIMLAEPARVAGVRDRVITTAPGEGGAPHPAMIVAAATCGLDRLWLIGGAQAIAALALGVWTPRAQKIFGPGNAYVAEAKRQAAALPNGPAIDLPAGPSELMVIADRGANAAMVASDLLSQAEHDADAQVMLVSASDELLAEVEVELQRQLTGLPRESIARRSIEQARAIRVRSLVEAVGVANDYAPEHLSLQVATPGDLVDSIENAGAVFIGAYTAESFSDYVVGPSHVLPTDAAAKSYGGVSVASFMKSFTQQEVSAAGAQRLAGAAARLARLEGLEAHARAADIRFAPARPAEEAVRRRCGEIKRTTKETKIVARVDLDSVVPVSISTGVGFFDHMLEQVAHHGGFSLTLSCAGDLHIDAHHSIEDCAIAFGQALKGALSDRRGIARFGFVLPMDEAEAKLSIDLGGRPYLVFDGAFAAPAIGAYPTEMTKHVFRSLAENLGATIHLSVTGENDHHKTEACFKALGRALRSAIRVESADLPSTKGVI
ncbi:histidinol dehydrogenase [Terricaulis silvestris]|uniref:Imidazoleglycerol-phosphate dehydratase n=1 Tax=Terricaulis silvestris TaxID=2686094 RepID=A0A6I6MK92_9CAUL|nr:histidinol dehydrogenase [Terricaulis silvestris]QGZ93628.1 Histidinol dehydrogenase [Terricaulis silvestris]